MWKFEVFPLITFLILLINFVYLLQNMIKLRYIGRIDARLQSSANAV